MDWPSLNAMINTASGASWVSIHLRRSGHRPLDYAGQVSLADGYRTYRAEAGSGTDK